MCGAHSVKLDACYVVGPIFIQDTANRFVRTTCAVLVRCGRVGIYNAHTLAQ